MREKKKQKYKKEGECKTKKEMGNSQIYVCSKGIVMAYAVTCIIFITYGIVLTYTDVTEEKLPLIALLFVL